jgi:hypothetical protein
MTATCQIKVPLETRAICGKLLKTPDFNTSLFIQLLLFNQIRLNSVELGQIRFSEFKRI